MVTGASNVSGVCAATPDVLFITKIIRAIYPSAMNAFKYGFFIMYVLYQTYELTVWDSVGTTLLQIQNI